MNSPLKVALINIVGLLICLVCVLLIAPWHYKGWIRVAQWIAIADLIFLGWYWFFVRRTKHL